jgi:hypothetical protein
VSRGYGNITTEGSITLEMSEIEALTNVAPSRQLWNIPEFDIIITFIPEGGTGTVTHILKNCRFMSNGRDVNQNDMTIVKQLDLKISHIIW